MWYWKPEQPPPTTATRNATGTGVCMLMISFTLLAATGVKLIIIRLASASRSIRDASLPEQYSKTLRAVQRPGSSVAQPILAVCLAFVFRRQRDGAVEHRFPQSTPNLD